MEKFWQRATMCTSLPHWSGKLPNRAVVNDSNLGTVIMEGLCVKWLELCIVLTHSMLTSLLAIGSSDSMNWSVCVVILWTFQTHSDTGILHDIATATSYGFVNFSNTQIQGFTSFHRSHQLWFCELFKHTETGILQDTATATSYGL